MGWPEHAGLPEPGCPLVASAHVSDPLSDPVTYQVLKGWALDGKPARRVHGGFEDDWSERSPEFRQRTDPERTPVAHQAGTVVAPSLRSRSNRDDQAAGPFFFFFFSPPPPRG